MNVPMSKTSETEKKVHGMYDPSNLLDVRIKHEETDGSVIGNPLNSAIKARMLETDWSNS